MSGSFTLIRRVVLMGLPFFLCGHLAGVLQGRLKHPLTGRRAGGAIAAVLLLWLLEVGAVLAAQWQQTIVITFFLYPLVLVTLVFLIQNPNPQMDLYAPKCRAAANFMYYAHPLYMSMLALLGNVIGITISSTVVFLLVVWITAYSSKLILSSGNHFLHLLIS